MTFIPQVITKIDPNNSTTLNSTSYLGTSTSTTGYNSIILTIESNNDSDAGGIEIKFSNNLTGTFTTYYSDTYFTNTIFTKVYPIPTGFYQISYTTVSSTFTITSRLSTDSPNPRVNSVSTFDNNFESTQDAFGKLRVSNPQTLLDIKFPNTGNAGSTGATGFYANNLQVSTGFTGLVGATGYYNTSSNSELIINVSGNGTFTSQSRNFCTYQPGKSLLILMSAILDSGVSNGYLSGNGSGMNSNVGYFDDYNGLYFNYIANGSGTGNSSVNIKKNSSLNTITQSDWNIDKMDGLGTSGLNLDWTKAQIFVIDMEWLGSGRVRFGLYAYGKIFYCHQITNINILGTGPYTSNINLPIRVQLVGGTGLSGSINQICSTVISEGGYNPAGRPFCINTGTTGVTFSSGEAILLALRGGGGGSSTINNYYHQIILPTLVGVISSNTNDFFIFRLRMYRDGVAFTNSATTWVNVNDTNSVCQYATFATPGGTLLNPSLSIIVDTNYVLGKGINSLNDLNNVFSNNVLQLTSNVNNVADVLVLTVQPVSGSVVVFGQLSWQEIY
jgi:hypothetical protein